MTIKLGVVMDFVPLHERHDESTIAMLMEAQKRNWEVFYMEQHQLFLKDAKTYATAHMIKIKKDFEIEFSKEAVILLSDLDIILMRKDPPVDLNYIYTTYLLDKAEADGVFVVNRPSSLRNFNEKLFAQEFSEFCPPTLVTSQIDLLKSFLAEHHEIILKPLNYMGGHSIFYIRENTENVKVILELMTEKGTKPVMAQQFIPVVNEGDKRILMVDGEPIPHILMRVPTAGSICANLAAGGCVVKETFTDRDRAICEKVGPILKQQGLLLVGLDVIGEYLTEINITSPGCITEFYHAFKVDIAKKLFDVIETKFYERGKRKQSLSLSGAESAATIRDAGY